LTRDLSSQFLYLVKSSMETLLGDISADPSLTGGLKAPERILVQRSPQRCRLYRFSLDLPVQEVIIPENAEWRPEFPGVLPRE